MVDLQIWGGADPLKLMPVCLLYERKLLRFAGSFYSIRVAVVAGFNNQYKDKTG
jgi:hypothetical protein